MIRLAGRLLVVCLLVAVGACSAWVSRDLWAPVLSGAGFGGLGESRASAVYTVARDSWLVFPAPLRDSAARIVSHADIPSEIATDLDAEYPYRLLVQLVDEDNAVLQERSMDFRTRVTRHVDVESGELYSRTFYLEAGLVPSGSREARVLVSRSGAVSMRVRLEEADPRIAAVQVRAYRQESIAAHRIAFQWQRMSIAQQERLAAGNLYPVEFLTRREKLNLLRNRWRPVGPRGVEGTDYQARKLYTLERDGEPYEPPGSAAGMYADAGLSATFPVPVPGGSLALEITPEPGAFATDERGVRAAAIWYGPRSGQRQEFVLGAGNGAIPALQLEPGLVEVKVDRPARIRAWFASPDGEELEVTGRRDVLRVYRVSVDRPVRFPVRHAPGEATDLRVDLRCECFDERPDWGVDTVSAQYRLLDAGGATVQAGALQVPVPWSRYDRIARDPLAPVSEPGRFVFRVPPDIVALEITGDPQLHVALYNRPTRMPRRVVLPEDYQRGTGDRVRRTWFPLRPADREQRIADGRSELLRVSARPPEEDAEIIAGRYRWEDFQPRGRWTARHVMEPRDPLQPFRDRALPTTFREVFVGDSRVAFRSPGAAGVVHPRLVYLRDGDAPLNLRVYVDGEQAWSGRVYGTAAEIPLGAVRTGERRLRVSASGPVRLLVNYAGPGDGGWIKRLAVRPRAGAQEILYAKETPGEETLSAIYYAAPGNPPELSLTVEVADLRHGGIGPFEKVTIRDWLFTLRLDDEPQLPVLDVPGEQVAAGQRMYIPLGADLSPGLYRVRLTIPDTPRGYLVLSRLLPGLDEVRMITREQEAGGGDD